MAEYKEEHISGKKWQRVNKVVIHVPHGAAPFITAEEETALEIDGNVILTPNINGIRVEFSENDSFQLRNPTDDSLIGDTKTHSYFHMLVYSLIRDAQIKRDTNV